MHVNVLKVLAGEREAEPRCTRVSVNLDQSVPVEGDTGPKCTRQSSSCPVITGL